MAIIKTFRANGTLAYTDIDNNFDNLNTDKIERVVSVNDNQPALRITQAGSGDALRVEDTTNPDSTPFVIDNSGNVSVGGSLNTPSLIVAGNQITGSGYSNMVVFNASGNWIAPTTKAKVTVIGGSGANNTGGASSFIGPTTVSATGGGARTNGTENSGGVGFGGDINLSGQIGGYAVFRNFSGGSFTITIEANGGTSAMSVGFGAPYRITSTLSAGQLLAIRGGAGGGGAIKNYSDLVVGQSYQVNVGASGGSGASAGIVIIEY